MSLRIVRMLACVAAVSAAAVPDVQGQGTGSFLGAHRLELDAGALWLGGVDFGTADATLTANQSARAGYTLFKTSSELAPTLGTEARLGFHVTRVFSVEAAFGYARPSLETRVSADVENAPATTATERLSQFSVDVSGVAHIWTLQLKSAVPFVVAGAGYLRELHAGNVIAESGHTYHVGGGMKLPFVVRRGFVRALGLRLDARAIFRSGGADLDASTPARVTGAGAASLLIGF